MRRLDIGVASYGNPDGLSKLYQSVGRHSRTDWRLRVIVNPHPDKEQREAVNSICNAIGGRPFPTGVGWAEIYWQKENIGYVGAVNKILELAETEYVAYLDHDVEILTDGWDELMAHALDRFHEIGMIFPSGARTVPRAQYDEILWGVGCCWMIPARVARLVGGFDSSLGHHEEVDYQTRVRLEGLKIAAARGVGIAHAARASSDPAAQDRIGAGVVRWMNKWTAYFGGKGLNYHSPNVLRHDDWPTSALHLEKYFRFHLPGLNTEPEVVTIEGVEYDLIKVPRPKGFYRGRVI